MELIGLLSKPKINQSVHDSSFAILTPGSILTYGQLELSISNTIKALVKLGVKRLDKIAVLSENNKEYVVLVLSLWNMGAIPVPVNVRLLPNEIEELVSFAGCKFVFTDNHFKDLLTAANIKSHLIPLADEQAGNILTDNIQYPDSSDKFNLNNTALVIFTSGSSGKSKGVVLSFNNLLHSAMNANKLFHHTQKDRWLASLPFYHIGGFSVITRNFFYGTSLIIPKSLKNEDLMQAIEKFKPTLTSLVTTQLKRLIEAGCKPNPELRQVLLGGGFIETALVSEALDKGWKVSKSYGTSETSSFVTVLYPEEFKFKPLSAGRAIPPNEILVLDDNKNILPHNETGEIAVKAQSVAKGYLNNDEETRKKFIDNIFYSGDHGYLDDKGFLFIEARREDLIISGGENINPLEIENEILKYNGIKETCVFGLNDTEWGDIVAAAIVSENEISVDELREFLKNKLPAFKHPKKIFILDKLPKTELGKIQRGKVKENFKD